MSAAETFQRSHRPHWRLTCAHCTQGANVYVLGGIVYSWATNLTGVSGKVWNLTLGSYILIGLLALAFIWQSLRACRRREQDYIVINDDDAPKDPECA